LIAAEDSYEKATEHPCVDAILLPRTSERAFNVTLRSRYCLTCTTTDADANDRIDMLYFDLLLKNFFSF